MSETIRCDALSVDFDGTFLLDAIDWTLAPDEHWLIVGANGSGKSALAAALVGAGERMSGKLTGVPDRIGVVSYEAQGELIEAERRKDDADILDVIAEGTPVRELAFVEGGDQALAEELIDAFGLTSLLDREFRNLSTGETRKLMLVRALSSRPELLVLDEPFDGLDAASLVSLQQRLAMLARHTRIVMVLNRLDELPDFITHIAWVDSAVQNTGMLRETLRRDDKETAATFERWLHLKTSRLVLPDADPADHLPPLDSSSPLVKLTGATVRYGDTVIFEGVDWVIERDEHWQLIGPNGSGKTALLSLITGDHPQCYVNDIVAFGYRRGSGESIWEIKRYIGYVSTALQWEYRVGTSLRNVVISGFHDSIGLYAKSTDEQRRIADAWLALLSMSSRADVPFTSLSHGDQRLLLIARAMVKHPPLLILDEPCLGLDEPNRRLVLALIERICASGTSTVLYVNHHAGDKIAGIDKQLALGGQAAGA